MVPDGRRGPLRLTGIGTGEILSFTRLTDQLSQGEFLVQSLSYSGTLRTLVAISISAAAAGCASSRATVDSTRDDWANDSYVSPDTAPSEHSARVLDMAPETADETMQVASLRLPVHASPSVGSDILAWLDQGSAVHVREWSRFVREPETASMSEAGQRQFVPTWALVDCGDGMRGYVGARSLITPELFSSMDLDASMELIDPEGDTGGQGFSEKRRRSATAVKGAAGSFSREGSDYEAADRVIESAIARGGATGFAGTGLEALDPDRARAIGEKRAADDKARKERGSTTSSVIGAVGGMFGGGDEAKLAAAVAEVAGELLAESEPTPLDELVLARECMAAVLGSAPVVPSTDPRSVRLRTMGNEIAASSSLPYPLLGYQFILQDDDETINAFASPGGAIFFTTAMLDFLEDDEELASILAHEIAHVEERHGVKLAKESGYDKLPAFRRIFTLVAEGQLDGVIDDMLDATDLPAGLKVQARDLVRDQVLELASDGFEELMLTVFDGIRTGESQAAETAADLRGMSLAAASAYDPRALESVLARLQAETGDYGGASYSQDRLGEAQEISPLLMAGFERLVSETGGRSGTLVAVETDGVVEPAERSPRAGSPSKQGGSGEGRAADAGAISLLDDLEVEPEVVLERERPVRPAVPTRQVRQVVADRTLIQPSSDGDLGEQLLALVRARGVGSSSLNQLALASAQRYWKSVGGEVTVIDLDLPRDGFHRIPSMGRPWVLLVAGEDGRHPQVYGRLGGRVVQGADRQDVSGQVRTFELDKDEEVLLWDRERRPDGWRGFVVIMRQ